MNCIGPVMPDDAELLAYADDEADFSIREHVSRCVACQLRAHNLNREQHTLVTLLHRAGCPSSQELGEYHLRLLGEQRAAYVAEHLSYCPACREEVADLAAFIARLRRPVAERAEALFGTLRTIAAHLSMNPSTGPAGVFVPALRGTEDDSEQAPMVYDAEDILVTVDSWIERQGQPGRAVAGLVVGPVDFSGAEASMDAEVVESTTPINNLGNFLFSAVSPGIHHLMIRLPATGIQIEIDELSVK